MSNEKSASQVAEELVSVPNGLRPGAGETILISHVADSTPDTRPITEPPSVRPPTPGNIVDRTG
ncbi:MULTISPECIES: hypothetical protein [unclassified Microcoleus]|uniref:hypothetical protein n=1 Tax=unclassified Microcoleus TaxID=2642155 RepID=UPI002FD6FAF6